MSGGTWINQGRAAYCDGKPIIENPHPRDTARFTDWRNGWLMALDVDPLLDEDERQTESDMARSLVREGLA